jgi:GH24 family phage-related lysozyme (muramidase)
MADTFAPKLQSEIGYEQPLNSPMVIPPSNAKAESLQLFSNMLSTAGDIYNALQPTAAEKKSAQDKQNSDYASNELARIEAIREEKGDSAATAEENLFAVNFTSRGGNIDTNFQEFYQAATGRPFKGFGMTDDQYVVNQLRQTPDYQASFIAASAVLGPDASSEDKDRYSLGQMSKVNAAADLVNRTKADASIKWTQETETAYVTGLNQMFNVIIGSAVGSEGSAITPSSIEALALGWEGKKYEYTRPANITDDQWKPIQAKVDSINGFVEQMKAVAASPSKDKQVFMDRLTLAIGEHINSGGNVENAAVALLAMSDINSFINNSGIVTAKVLDSLSARSKDFNKVKMVDLSTALAEATNSPLNGTFSPNEVITELPEQYKDMFANVDAKQHLKDLEANKILSDLITPANIQTPEAKKQWADSVAGIGITLLNSDSIYSDTFIKKYLGNRTLYENLNILDGVDQSTANTVRVVLRSGIANQRIVQEKNLAAIESTMPVVWDGSKYVINSEALAAKVTGNITSALGSADRRKAIMTANASNFVSQLALKYNNDLAAAALDGWRKIERTDWKDSTLTSAGLHNLDEALSRRGSLTVMNQALEALRVDTGEDIAGDTRKALDATKTTSQPVSVAFDIVRSFEGYRENSYYDVNAYRTGYGSDTVTKADGTVAKVTKDTMVTREDAERDLARRLPEFNASAERKVGSKVWSALDETTRGPLLSIAYNYGSIPDRLMEAIKSGDNEAIATAVEGLAGDNKGINSDRRMQEAQIIRTGEVTPYSEGQTSYPSQRASEPEQAAATKTGSGVTLGTSFTPAEVTARAVVDDAATTGSEAVIPKETTGDADQTTAKRLQPDYGNSVSNFLGEIGAYLGNLSGEKSAELASRADAILKELDKRK